MAEVIGALRYCPRVWRVERNDDIASSRLLSSRTGPLVDLPICHFLNRKSRLSNRSRTVNI
jgi:hypothetical protein